jgi:sugar-specific transcriptional regulator TrmB
MQELAVTEVLDRLVAKGVLERKSGEPDLFRYAPPDPEFSAVLDIVVERYEASSLDILRIMSANSVERLRRAALRTVVESQKERGPKRD